MQEPSASTLASSARKVRPPADIAITTVLTMAVVFLISEFSVETGVAIGCFAGFCVAAWNWFRMGRWRKALVHLVLGLGVYLLFHLCYVLLAILLWRLSPSTLVDVAVNIPGGFPSATDVTINPQTKGLIQIALLLFSLGSGALVVTYLYKATFRDVQKIEPGSDLVEIYNFLPLLGIAAISVSFVIAANTLLGQVRTAQFQNHVYCDLLQPSMTRKEVDAALDKLGPHLQGWPEDLAYPSPSKQATSYDFVIWDNSHLERDYNLDLWLGYDAEGKLVWKGRTGPNYINAAHLEQGLATIECPWTFSQSVTAR